MKKAKILIVEDEAIIALNIKMVLENSGYEVLPLVFNAEKAFQSAVTNKPDVILMDIQLQGKQDGIDAASKILDEYEVPIIYITGNIDMLKDVRLIKTSRLKILEKPPSDWELLEAVEEFVK